jgi:hypothetical protein
MTTEQKLEKVFKSLEGLKAKDNVSVSFKQGITAAMNSMKIWFDTELISAEIDPTLDYTIPEENKKQTV